MDDTLIIDAFNHNEVPQMIVGPKGTILHCNNATHCMLGYDGDDLLGRSIADIFPSVSVVDLKKFIKPPAKATLIKEMIGQKQNGTPVPLSINMATWNDDQKGLMHVLSLRDVSEDLEICCHKTEMCDRIHSAVEAARIGIFEYDPISEDLRLSNVWRELLELENVSIPDIEKEWQSRVHPENLSQAIETVNFCKYGHGDKASFEYRYRSKDKSHWKWMHTNISVFKRDDTGRPISLIGSLTDITDRKVAESSLRMSLEQFQSVFDSPSVGKAIVGLDGKLQRVNTTLCELLGYQREDVLKADIQTFSHPDDIDDNWHKLGLLMTGSISSFQAEKRFIRANGSIMWGFLGVNLVRNAQGDPDHLISQVVDVTEQRRLHELKNEFVSTVSHELRTPLTSVLGAVTLLSSMDESFSDQAQRLLFIAEKNSLRLRDLINDVLDFEKFSAKQMRFSLSQEQIAELVDDAITANSDFGGKFGVRFDVDCPDRDLTGFVDPKRFQQVMTNLLTNAAKFADEGSAVGVIVKGQNETVQVSVINQGNGIPEEFKADIFKPFSQADTALTRERSGTGLGLHITKQIVEQMGGAIGFESGPDGRTTFWFTVPINAPS
jgi:PAS domain S-box-containing protein